MKLWLFILAALFGYLIGAWNPAIFLSKLLYRQDIRTVGSGNPGFTNFKRSFGGKFAWLVMVLDLGKAAVAIALFASLFLRHTGSYQLGAAYTGAFCMIGHAFPVFYGFKGGKGFLVLMSTVWFVDVRAGLVATAVLALLLFTTHYMSLSTMVAMALGVASLWLWGMDSLWVFGICAIEVLFMVWRHRENIRRLCKGEEHKFYFSKGKRS